MTTTQLALDVESLHLSTLLERTERLLEEEGEALVAATVATKAGEPVERIFARIQTRRFGRRLRRLERQRKTILQAMRDIGERQP